MSKHTAGQWYISAPSREFNGKLMILANVPDDNPVHICEVTTNTRGSKINVTREQDSYAALIVAAPDLLQELRNIATADTSKWDDRSDFEAWAKSRAQAAIAKVEGGAA